MSGQPSPPDIHGTGGDSERRSAGSRAATATGSRTPRRRGPCAGAATGCAAGGAVSALAARGLGSGWARRGEKRAASARGPGPSQVPHKPGQPEPDSPARTSTSCQCIASGSGGVTLGVPLPASSESSCPSLSVLRLRSPTSPALTDLWFKLVLPRRLVPLPTEVRTSQTSSVASTCDFQVTLASGSRSPSRARIPGG